VGDGVTDDKAAILRAIAAAAAPTEAPMIDLGRALARFPSTGIRMLARWNVMDFGAHADGTTDDVAHIQSAIMAAGAAPVYFPPGDYKLASTLTVPSYANLIGSGMATAWLKGKVFFSSNSSFSDLKIGDSGSGALHHIDGATATIFTRCHIRGGLVGETPAAWVNNTINLGNDASCDHITFVDCEVERNLGASNNLSIIENGSTSGGAHVSDITFSGCHVGVTNGTAIGGPRMGIECYTSPNGSNVALHGWSNVNIINCVFEATNSCCVDFADYPLGSGDHASGPVLVSGCTIKGGGYGGGIWGYAVCIESPHDVIIENNTIYRGYNRALNVGYTSGLPTGLIIRDNTIDLTYDNGITPTGDQYTPANEILGSNVTISGNTFTTGTGGGGQILVLDTLSSSSVTGNHFYDSRASSIPRAIAYLNCTSDSITGNDLHNTGSTSNPIIFDAGGNTGMTVSGNTLTHN